MSDVAAMVADGENGLPGSSRRKRHRQRKKRPTPYEMKTGSVRAQEVRHEMFNHGQPVAPYNTTQFLIEDHGDLHNIDAQLNKAPDSHRHARTRDSSFSIDSEDAYFYSSPEDEEEFLTKEFSNEYADLHVERLNSLSKSEIIRDYLMLESKYEKSVSELRKMKTDSGRDTDASSRSDVDVNEQLRLAQLENRRLKNELEKIKRDNLLQRRHSSVSSIDSESDSSSTSSPSSSSSSGADVTTSPPAAPAPPEDTVQKEEEEKP